MQCCWPAHILKHDSILGSPDDTAICPEYATRRLHGDKPGQEESVVSTCDDIKRQFCGRLGGHLKLKESECCALTLKGVACDGYKTCSSPGTFSLAMAVVTLLSLDSFL